MKYSINANFQLRANGQRIEFVKGSEYETTDESIIAKLDATKEAVKIETKTTKSKAAAAE
jgi:hypothetical protein